MSDDWKGNISAKPKTMQERKAIALSAISKRTQAMRAAKGYSPSQMARAKPETKP